MGRTFTRLWVAALACIAVVACDGATVDQQSSTPRDVVELVGRIEWSMAPRFGLDADGDGLIDIPNTREYVLNIEQGSCGAECAEVIPAFEVVLDATGIRLVDGGGESLPIEEFNWTLTGPAGDATRIAGDSSQLVTELAEGDHNVTLEVVSGPHRRMIEEAIGVRDLVIVAIGDSYVAGEGSPERPGDPPQWADAGGPDDLPQALDHDAAHRSGLAGAAQAALAMEKEDPHTSITFLFLAASGAGIEDGLLEPPDPTDTGAGGKRALRPQVEELGHLMGCNPGGSGCQRAVDHLIVSVGGNDVGFGFTVGSLIALDPLLLLDSVYQDLLDNLIAAVAADIAELPGLFDRLAAALGVIDIDHVVLAGYPGSQTVAVDGEIESCDEVGTDLLPGLELDQRELEAVRDGLQVPLNETLRSVAATHEWTFVDSHVAAFEGHGYCGSDPYDGGAFAGNPFPGSVTAREEPGVRWFRTATESAEIQGGGGFFRPERLATSGTFHPNEFGHQAYRDALLAAIGDG